MFSYSLPGCPRSSRRANRAHGWRQACRAPPRCGPPDQARRCRTPWRRRISHGIPAAGGDLRRSQLAAQASEFAHLYQFEVVTERRRVLGKVAVYVEHAAVVVPKHAHPVFPHAGHGLGRGDPLADFVPRRLLLKKAGDDVIVDAGTLEHRGDFRRTARLAMFQPHPGHEPTIAERVECGIIDLGHRLQVEHDHWRFRALHDGSTVEESA